MYPWMCSWLWLVLAWMGSYCVPCEGQVLEDLIRLYEATNGTGWIRQDNWLTSTHYCYWKGVTCSDNVTLARLELQHNNLVGTLPANLSFISTLSTFDLSFNSLSGTLPAWSMLNSVSVRLNDNQFQGEIPPFEAPSILILFLNYNQFSGSIPIHESWSSLAFLDVAHNKISGTIPSYINLLTSLMFLNINHNDISGTLPPALFAISSMQYLFMSHNRLFGDIPNMLSRLSQLSQLNLEDNKLIGTLPEQFSLLSDLRTVNVFNNTCGGCSSFSDGWEFCKRGYKYHCGLADPCANITLPPHSNYTFWDFNYSFSCWQLVCSKQNSSCSSIVERFPTSCSGYDPRTICVDDIYYLRAEVVNVENTTLALSRDLEVVGALNVSTLAINNSTFIVNGIYSTKSAYIQMEQCTFEIRDRVDCINSVILMDPHSSIRVDRCVNFAGTSIHLNLTNYTAIGKFSVLNLTNPDPRCTPVWPEVLPLVQNNIECFRVSATVRTSALEIETMVVPGCNAIPLTTIVPAVVGGTFVLVLAIGVGGVFYRNNRLETLMKNLRKNASEEKKEPEE